MSLLFQIGSPKFSHNDNQPPSLDSLLPAGKSTLLRTMKALLNEHVTVYQHMKHSGHHIRRLLTSHSAAASSHDLNNIRTEGVGIHLLKETHDMRIFAWDFAGHRQFHALYDFMFPSGTNAATIFVFTYSPFNRSAAGALSAATSPKLKKHERFHEELLYWLRFVASSANSSSIKPQVVVVVTNKDKVSAQLQGNMYEGWKSGIVDTIA